MSKMEFNDLFNLFLVNALRDYGILSALILLVFNYREKIQNYITGILREGNDKSNILKIPGFVMIDTSGFERYQFCDKFRALSWYLHDVYPKISSRVYCIDMNKTSYFERSIGNSDFFVDYSEGEIQLVDDIKFSVSKSSIAGGRDIITETEYMYTLTSKNSNLTKFIDEVVKLFDKHNEEKNRNKLYHFIYEGFDTKTQLLKFTSEIIDSGNYENTESFDTLFHEHKDMLQTDVKKLRDIGYYKKTGLKRKKGYLFHGDPGCGKTGTVMAMALEDKRHILEVSLARIKTNREFGMILNISEIHGVKFKKSNLIVLFDEIDRKNNDGKEDKNNEDKTKPSDENKDTFLFQMDDKLNIGSILSRLDGIGNYGGLIIIGTTNNIDTLDPALYRDLRLTPLHFTFSRKEDIIDMASQFYTTKFTDEELVHFPDRNAKLTPATIKHLLDTNTREKFIEKMTSLSV